MIEDGLALGHEAAERAHGAATAEWHEKVRVAFLSVMLGKRMFSSNDIYRELGGALPPGADPRAIGAVFRRYAAVDMIRPTNDYEPSNQRRQHGRPVRVWVSLVSGERA